MADDAQQRSSVSGNTDADADADANANADAFFSKWGAQFQRGATVGGRPENAFEPTPLRGDFTQWLGRSSCFR